MILRLLTIILFGALVQSCSFKSTIDEEGNITAYKTSKIMRAYGERSFEKLKKTKEISKDTRHHKQLDRVATQLKKVINMPDADWDFVIFKNPSANAFALPGGKVGVHAGLFELINDENSERSDALLAAVLGHEISHATSKHAEYRMYRGLALFAIGSALWYGLDQHSDSHDEHAATGFAAFTLATYLMDSLPLSRWQEYESDRIGAVYMAKAGYDPREAINLWRRLEYYHSLSGKSKPNFLRTHPPDDARIKKLQNFMPVALKFYNPKNTKE